MINAQHKKVKDTMSPRTFGITNDRKTWERDLHAFGHTSISFHYFQISCINLVRTSRVRSIATVESGNHTGLSVSTSCVPLFT